MNFSDVIRCEKWCIFTWRALSPEQEESELARSKTKNENKVRNESLGFFSLCSLTLLFTWVQCQLTSARNRRLAPPYFPQRHDDITRGRYMFEARKIKHGRGFFLRYFQTFLSFQQVPSQVRPKNFLPHPPRHWKYFTLIFSLFFYVWILKWKLLQLKEDLLCLRSDFAEFLRSPVVPWFWDFSKGLSGFSWRR